MRELVRGISGEECSRHREGVWGWGDSVAGVEETSDQLWKAFGFSSGEMGSHWRL